MQQTATRPALKNPDSGRSVSFQAKTKTLRYENQTVCGQIFCVEWGGQTKHLLGCDKLLIIDDQLYSCQQTSLELPRNNTITNIKTCFPENEDFCKTMSLVKKAPDVSQSLIQGGLYLPLRPQWRKEEAKTTWRDKDICQMLHNEQAWRAPCYWSHVGAAAIFSGSNLSTASLNRPVNKWINAWKPCFFS